MRADLNVIDLDRLTLRAPEFRHDLPGGAKRLVQEAEGYVATFVAGTMTCISALGALLMKTAAPPILRRFGFRSVLLVNAFIVAASFMAYALFRPDWPHWAIAVVLGVGGFFRSLQFTSLNGMAYADIDQDQMSKAATTSSMAQQLVQSIGIGLSASLLAACASLAPGLPYQPPHQPEGQSGYTDKPGWQSSRFAVAAANPLATEAGVNALKRGGNAVAAGHVSVRGNAVAGQEFVGCDRVRRGLDEDEIGIVADG